MERDVFTPEAGYPVIEVDGIPLRDRVWLSLSLHGSVRAGTAAAMALRVVRHTERLEELAAFYRDGLGLAEIGLGTALTVLQAHDALARGCRTASLQSTEMAERIYTAVGFRDLGRHLEYVP